MTEDEVIRVLRKYFESLFPKACSNCNRGFSTLREYIQVTKRIGPTVSYDAGTDDWKSGKPIGTMATANCPCGSTLALTTQKMELRLRMTLLNWVMSETQQRGVGHSELLEHLRDEVRKSVLADRTRRDT